jgi:hypothetical protein
MPETHEEQNTRLTNLVNRANQIIVFKDGMIMDMTNALRMLMGLVDTDKLTADQRRVLVAADHLGWLMLEAEHGA